MSDSKFGDSECAKLYHNGYEKDEDDLLYLHHLVPSVADPRWLGQSQRPMDVTGIGDLACS